MITPQIQWLDTSEGFTFVVPADGHVRPATAEEIHLRAALGEVERERDEARAEVDRLREGL